MRQTNSSKLLAIWLGKAISISQNALDMSMDELSNSSCLDEKLLARIKDGHEDVTLQHLQAIANALNTSPAQLLTTAESLSKIRPLKRHKDVTFQGS